MAIISPLQSQTSQPKQNIILEKQQKFLKVNSNRYTQYTIECTCTLTDILDFPE